MIAGRQQANTSRGGFQRAWRRRRAPECRQGSVRPYETSLECSCQPQPVSQGLINSTSSLVNPRSLHILEYQVLGREILLLIFPSIVVVALCFDEEDHFLNLGRRRQLSYDPNLTLGYTRTQTYDGEDLTQLVKSQQIVRIQPGL